MKSVLSTAVAALFAANAVSAHYIFQYLTVGGTKYNKYQYIRENSNDNSPVTDLSSNDLRCNVLKGTTTDTISVRAGDSISFTADIAVYHQGPTSLYLSKAPGSAASYDGSGGWFKFKDFGPDFSKGGGGNTQWPLYQTYTFNLPSCIQDGEYLLRISQLGIHNPGSPPQFYSSCAQIKVSGGGSLNPSTVSIPGAYKATDPGYTVNIYQPDFNSYTVPGPAPITCGGGSQPPASSTPAGPTTMATSTRPATSSAAPTNGGNCAAKYGQCGGKGWTGATCCVSSTCTVSNEFYSQCL